MKFLYSFFFLFLISMIFIFAGCNKDDIIEIENPDKPYGLRPVTPQSQATIDRVYEYTPAPGQFINDFGHDISNVLEISPSDAAEWAFTRLKKHNFVSLGAFGGYIVTGFDHSIINIGDYEIGIFGNAFLSQNGSSNEPGIVYVMKDENGNGLPDDTWYELQGSDTFAPGTIADYKVTYFKPEGEEEPVKWKDNLGNEGEISYMGVFHSQPSYYPMWINKDSYTLSGTCLKAKTFKNPETGNWENPPFIWGYADNMGDDNIDYEDIKNCNRFKISNAIDTQGNPKVLDYIDFIKVQTGVCATSGWLGEVSTEILGILDLTL